MQLRTENASRVVSGLLLAIVVAAGFKLVMAQPKGDSSRPASDIAEATFEHFGEHKFVNIHNIAYTRDGANAFDIYFACSGATAPDPLRLTDAKDMMRARSFFKDETRSGKRFMKLDQYCINAQQIAYIESSKDRLVINFNTRIGDAFAQVTSFGADADRFRKTLQAP